MKTICLYFEIHQNIHLKRYRFFDIGTDHYYYDDYEDERSISETAERSYIPALKTLIEMAKENKGFFKCAISLSGCTIELLEIHAPQVIELIHELKASDADFCIGAACYPEKHPESANQREDIQHLKEKVDAGADFLTTQMIFDNNLFFSFLYKLREAGVTCPVLPGIMPITNANQVERAIKLSGSFMPQRFKSLVDKFGSDPDAMKQAGIIYASDQIIDLYANGITNVHVYSMNKPDVAEGILKNVSAILGKNFV